MPEFPAFLDLTRKTVLIVGSGREAEKKAEKLALFCGKTEKCPYPPKWEELPFAVILAEKDNPENEKWAAHFKNLGVLVNVADRPQLCDFFFPSVIVRGGVTVGISSGGASPVLSSLLRERIESCLPEDMEIIAEAAASLTAQLRKTEPDQAKRVQILREKLERLLDT